MARFPGRISLTAHRKVQKLSGDFGLTNSRRTRLRPLAVPSVPPYVLSAGLPAAGLPSDTAEMCEHSKIGLVIGATVAPVAGEEFDRDQSRGP